MVSHFDLRIGFVGRLINACQHLYIWARTFVVRVPFFFLDDKGSRYALHDRMFGYFDIYGSLHERRDVVHVPDVSHKPGEPLPHWKAVELAQEGGVMEPYPAAFSFRNISLKGRYRISIPPVRRVVELDEERIAVEQSLVER